MKKHGLAARERVKSICTIERIFSKDSISIFRYPILLKLLIEDASGSSVKVGFSVSKRMYKKAVDRNRIKRWLRESYRQNKESLATFSREKNMHLSLFFILSSKPKILNRKEIHDNILHLLKSIPKKLESNNE